MSNFLSFRVLRFALPVALAGASLSASAAVSTYTFGGSLAAFEAGRPSLTAVDPTGGNNYSTAFLYGQNRSVYNTVGAAAFGSNAGVTLNAASLVTATQYSLEMVVSLATTSGYRKLSDTTGRTGDRGLYVLSDRFNVFPAVTGTQPVLANTYKYLAVTVNAGTVKGYVDGVLDFTVSTTALDGNDFAFFLDDSAVSSEWSAVSVGLLRLRDTVLTDAEVRTLAANPYAPVPEPGTLAAVGLGAAALLRRRRAR